MYRIPVRKLARNTLKSVIFRVAASGPMLATRLRRLASSQASTILNLHRVAPQDRSAYPPLDPRLFAELLDFICREFSVRPLDALEEPASKPRLALSFDDGYADFVDHAMPLLKRKGIRVNQNLIPQCIETGIPPLNVMVQDFVGQAPAELSSRIAVPGFTTAGADLAARLSDFIRYSPSAVQEEIAACLIPQMRDWNDFRPTPMMRVADIVALTDFVDFGAHSYSHASMACESDDFLRDDISRCREFFRRELGLPVEIYAFPNGSWRDGQIDILHAAGIRHALLVGEDFNRDSRVHTRFTFDARSSAEMRFKAMGGLTKP